MHNDHSFGLYPDSENNVKVILGTVVGKLIQESLSSISSADKGLAVKVSKQAYDYTWSNSESIRKQSISYDLISQSCVDFVNLTVIAMGLKAPLPEGLYNHPRLFIWRLEEINN